MRNDVSADWLFRVGSKHSGSVDLCHNLIGDHDSHAKLHTTSAYLHHHRSKRP